MFDSTPSKVICDTDVDFFSFLVRDFVDKIFDFLTCLSFRRSFPPPGIKIAPMAMSFIAVACVLLLARNGLPSRALPGVEEAAVFAISLTAPITTSVDLLWF